MPRKSKTDQELGWLRNIWEEMAATELKHGGFMKVELKPTASRARFMVRLVMTRPEGEGDIPGWAGSTRYDYPNAESTMFLPWLWGRANAFAEFCDVSDTVLKAPYDKTG
jgi:hypothetical protein